MMRKVNIKMAQIVDSAGNIVNNPQGAGAGAGSGNDLLKILEQVNKALSQFSEIKGKGKNLFPQEQTTQEDIKPQPAPQKEQPQKIPYIDTNDEDIDKVIENLFKEDFLNGIPDEYKQKTINDLVKEKETLKPLLKPIINQGVKSLARIKYN